MLWLVLNLFAPDVRNNPKTMADLGSDPIAKKVAFSRSTPFNQLALNAPWNSRNWTLGSVDTPPCPGFLVRMERYNSRSTGDDRAPTVTNHAKGRDLVIGGLIADDRDRAHVPKKCVN
jgi:hypothetical protein